MIWDTRADVWALTNYTRSPEPLWNYDVHTCFAFWAEDLGVGSYGYEGEEVLACASILSGRAVAGDVRFINTHYDH